MTEKKLSREEATELWRQRSEDYAYQMEIAEQTRPESPIERYKRRYLNNDLLVLSESTEEEVAKSLEAVLTKGRTVVIYRDRDSEPASVMLPYDRYAELLGGRVQGRQGVT